jgi:phosphoribosylaminoimidazolecarboxamide formyltransferase/IMP cyclohydrolase
MSAPVLHPIRSALLSVYRKDGLDVVVRRLHELGVTLYASGGTADFVRQQGAPVHDSGDLTGYPSILGGRVKTLHPKIFGGILARQAEAADQADLAEHGLPTFDLVIVDLYPFEQTLLETDDPARLIEKVDIGGVALIRAGGKNHNDVLIVPSADYYAPLLALLEAQGAETTLDQRLAFAAAAFELTAGYDRAIADWFASRPTNYTLSTSHRQPLRYGENPHQAAAYVGRLEDLVTRHGGKALSYNNLVDLDATLRLLAEFDPAAGVTACIIKHTNPCGVATRPTVEAAWDTALSSDPVSAFGGIIALNGVVDLPTAQKIHKHFYEVLVAPGYTPEALVLLLQKDQRIVLTYKHLNLAKRLHSTRLNGLLVQDDDRQTSTPESLQVVTPLRPSEAQLADLLFAEKCCKHLKSNAIALVRDQQMIGAGMGQTSRIDALQHALAKARAHGFGTEGAVLASDGFFPFADSVEAAHQAGITAILQPGGSVRDADSITYCTQHQLPMVLTGTRHFRH